MRFIIFDFFKNSIKIYSLDILKTIILKYILIIIILVVKKKKKSFIKYYPLMLHNPFPKIPIAKIYA